MTRLELITRLADHNPQLDAKDAESAVKMILDAMAQALLNGDRIEIRGFGSFDLSYRRSRTGRNPKSGEKVHVPQKYVPHFKAGKELRQRVLAAVAVADATRMISITANLGDTKSTITHPGTTTHGRISEEARARAGIKQDLLRVAVGLEANADIQADLARGLA